MSTYQFDCDPIVGHQVDCQVDSTMGAFAKDVQ